MVCICSFVFVMSVDVVAPVFSTSYNTAQNGGLHLLGGCSVMMCSRCHWSMDGWLSYHVLELETIVIEVLTRHLWTSRGG